MDVDAYGNALPRATRAQLAKEVGLYRRIARELAEAANAVPDPKDTAG